MYVRTFVLVRSPNIIWKLSKETSKCFFWRGDKLLSPNLNHKLANRFTSSIAKLPAHAKSCEAGLLTRPQNSIVFGTFKNIYRRNVLSSPTEISFARLRAFNSKR